MGREKEGELETSSLEYLNICIKKVDAKCWLVEMTLVMTLLPLTRVFQCLSPFALVSVSPWLVEIWQLSRRGATGELEVEFKFQRISCKCFLPFPSSETQGQSVGSGEGAWRKFSSTGERAPGYRLSPSYFQNFKRMPALDWAQKMLCNIVLNRRTVSPEFFSWVRTLWRRLLSCHTCPVRSPSLCEQGKFLFSTFLTRNEATTDE